MFANSGVDKQLNLYYIKVDFKQLRYATKHQKEFSQNPNFVRFDFCRHGGSNNLEQPNGYFGQNRAKVLLV